ncbi:MAG: DUF4199 domain-containing protein [Mucinivorans sp.]
MQEIESLKKQQNKEMQKQYFRLMLTAALIIGVLSMVPSYILYIIGVQGEDVPGYSWINTIYLLAIFVATYIYIGKQAREVKDPDGKAGYSYGQAYGFAILSAVLSSLVMCALTWLLTNVLAPEMMQQALDQAESTLLTQMPDASQNIIDTQMKMMRYMFSFTGLLVTSLFSMAIWGGLAGLISSAFVKREPVIEQQ